MCPGYTMLRPWYSQAPLLRNYTEGVIESIRINEVSVLLKPKNTLL